MFEEKSESPEKENERMPVIENATEEIINPESLTEQQISEMQSGASELEKDGLDHIGEANNSIGLDAENVEGVKNELQVSEKMSGMSDRAKELLKSAQAAMKKAVAIGMATMAFSGTAGNFDNGNGFEISSVAEAATLDAGNKQFNYEQKTSDEQRKNALLEKIKSGDVQSVFEDFDSFSHEPWAEDVIIIACKDGYDAGFKYAKIYLEAPWGKRVFEDLAYSYKSLFYQRFGSMVDNISRKYLMNVLESVFNNDPWKGIVNSGEYFEFINNDKIEKLIIDSRQSIIEGAHTSNLNDIQNLKGIISEDLFAKLLDEVTLMVNKNESAGIINTHKIKREYQEDEENYLESDGGKKIEAIRNLLLDHIISNEYLDRLAGEFNGDRDVALKEQKSRINLVKKTKINFTGNLKNKSEMETHINNLGALGIYTPGESIIDIPGNVNNITNDQLEYLSHELFHASTNANENISSHAKDILKNSSSTDSEYLNSSTERLVRKQRLDLEMEKLGIKKYGEKFTPEHYNKLMELYEDGKLFLDMNQLIESTKPEYFERMFNEIADNENGEDASSHNVV